MEHKNGSFGNTGLRVNSRRKTDGNQEAGSKRKAGGRQNAGGRQKTDRMRKRRISRRKTVLIEWAVLILVAVLSVCGIFLLLRRSHTSTGPEAAEEIQAGQTASVSGYSAQHAISESDSMSGDGRNTVETAASGSSGSNEAAKASDGMELAGGTAQETEKGKKDTYLFSFAGDCTIGSLLEWQGSLDIDFQSVVGDDYAYPLSRVKTIFEKDDLTIVNLEGTFTTASDAVVKPYRFRADPAYARVLTEGSVEAVSTANNHSGDFKEAGLRDTIAALNAEGILHTGEGAPLIQTLDGGLTIGIVSYSTVDNPSGEWQWRQSVQTDIETCRAAGCDLIIGFMHWGSVEYLQEPEAWEVQFAHDMADWGCSLIVGGHAHILQRMEYYHDVPIFYSMGNFCYGGNTNPDDKDSVIVQAEYKRDADEHTLRRSALKVIPCEISTRSDRNDYCPLPCEEGSEDYRRILEKLQYSE